MGSNTPEPPEVVSKTDGSECAETAEYDASVQEHPRQSSRTETVARPRSLRALVNPDGPAPPRLDGTIRLAAGPWHLEEAWWSGEAIDRDYWDVELTDGRMLRIYQDRYQGEWFADGVYD